MEKNNKKKTLIIVPDQNAENRRGGVHNFYKNLEKELDINHVYYFINNDQIKIKNKIYTTYIHFLRIKNILKKGNYNCLLLNPSLNINAVLRDSLFVMMAKKMKIETIVFWRGWNMKNIKYLKFPYILISKYLIQASKSIVLYSKIESSLRNIGHCDNVYNLTTMVDDDIFNYFVSHNNRTYFDLIFLSRVEIYKGVYELLEAYTILKEKYPKMKLTIAGNGDELNKLINKVKDCNIKDVCFSGYITGNEKYKLLADSDLFVFPSYSEGMPNAVLEAMAVGLPIVTTKVGGLNDFFIEDKMGGVVEIKNVNSLVEKIEELYLNANKRKLISKVNIKFASENFKKSIVYKKLKDIINI